MSLTLNTENQENHNPVLSFPRDILLVEDNPADIRLIKEALKDETTANELHAVIDGTDALNYLHEQCEAGNYPDIIILDLNLPKMNGFEFLKEIKNDAKLSKIPVIVFTTSSSEENLIKCYNMDAYAYITKPIDFDGFEPIIKLLKGL